MDESQNSETNQVTEATGLKAQFTTVTPLSKFLALALFVALPFVGFWLGLSYHAPMQTMDPQSIVSGQEASELCGQEPPVLCKHGSELGCRLLDKKWDCYPIDVQTGSGMSDSKESGSDAPQETVLNEVIGEVKDNVLEPPLPEDVFIDPQGKYRITIPEGLVYTYYPQTQEVQFGRLHIWTKEDRVHMQGLAEGNGFVEGGTGFVIEFIPNENMHSYSFPTEEEHVREIITKNGKVPIYQPIATLAGHEESWIRVSGGSLLVVNHVLTPESSSWFDTIIQNITIEEGGISGSNIF